MDNETVIKVDSVSKNFVIPHERTGSVKSVFTSMFRKVSTKKETQHALHDISLEVKKGEFFGIVGRNGSGKSTLLKILAGIYQPTTGHLTTTGKLVPFIELGVGFNPELSGRDNVYLNGAILGFSTKEVDAIYHDIVAFAELERFMDQKLKNYSSGMQVRLAFSMATRSNADILLIDEVLAVGDESFQRKCFQYFKKLKKNGTTVIFVTHDMGAVREFCDRAMLIEKSKVQATGSSSEIADLYSRMFLEEQVAEVSSDKNPNRGKRWGDGKAIIQTVKVEPKLVTDKNKTIDLSWEVVAKAAIEEPMYGFTVKNSEGNPVMGTNTSLSDIKVNPLKPGERTLMKWTIDNVLPEGLYDVVPAMGSRDNTVHDWWEEAGSFEIRRIRKNPYPIQPDMSGEVRTIK
ncbi:MAG TPA: ABC transporter ATP-binding protein [Candidatus Binatia bacterium]|nr:ABC transporter ATP-binding protein [Candidatus Binatia bacterium]